MELGVGVRSVWLPLNPHAADLVVSVMRWGGGGMRRYKK